jgi:hypothetical protein
MDRKTAPANARKRRNRLTLLWIAIAAAIIIGLIATEQVALLYVLVTLGVTVLLIIVAVADIGETQKSVDGYNAPTSLTNGTLNSMRAPSSSTQRPAKRR